MAKITGLNLALIFAEDAPETVDVYVTGLGFTVEELATMGAWNLLGGCAVYHITYNVLTG